MAITTAATTLILSAAITASLDNITHIALLNVGGEYLRKAYESVTKLTVKKYQFVFYFSELEGNDDIVSVELEGSGATLALDDGVGMATQALVHTKTATQSLTIAWVVETV